MTPYYYDVFGYLRRVGLHKWMATTRVTDARIRRVGKTVDGKSVQRWLYAVDL